MENYINIEKGYPKTDMNVLVICSDGHTHEVYWTSTGEWRDSETEDRKMFNVEKWKYV